VDLLDLDAFECDQPDEDVVSYWNSRSSRAKAHVHLHRPDIIERLKTLPGAE
jgi:CDP-diacylglycerol pyrophosphatase